MLEYRSRKQVKARQAHRCDICGSDIPPGCEYIREKYRDESGHHTVCSHIHCDAIAEAFVRKCNTEAFSEEPDLRCLIFNEFCLECCTDLQVMRCTEIQEMPFACDKCLSALNPVAQNAARESIAESAKNDTRRRL